MDAETGTGMTSMEADWATQMSAPQRHGPSRVGVPMQPVRLRLSPTMVRRVAEAARENGWTDSTWMRCAIAHRLASRGEDQLQVVRRYGGGGPDAAAMTALRLQLHQLGGLLTQVAKVARTDGEAARHADAEATLADVRAAIATVAAWQAERIP